jgi:hypothetical protein
MVVELMQHDERIAKIFTIGGVYCSTFLDIDGGNFAVAFHLPDPHGRRGYVVRPT